MSNERIDHAAEAQRIIDNPPGGEAVQRAQVHATLALVEQMRIANLIALGQYTIVPGEMPVYRSVIFHGEGIRPDITAALGLDTPND